MDFHSLTRRELQSLCKKNKIPANITNVAMADALKALEIVEGMEEFLKPCESETANSSAESPEKTVNTSPPVPPRTGCRTSTRRKPNQGQLESESILSRTRRGTRRTLGGEVENAKVDLPETPVMQSSRKKAPAALTRRKIENQLKEEAEEEKQAPETPAATTTRRRGTVVLSHRKTDTMKAEDTSVRRGYSTRRTTRLLEKRMMELNLNNEEGIQVDASDIEIPHLERNVKDDSDASDVKGMNRQAISDDLDASWDKQSDVLSENLRELGDPVQECMENNHEVDCLKVEPPKISEVFDKSDEHKDGLAIEDDDGGDDDDDEINHENKDTEQVEISEVFDKSGEHEDRLEVKNNNDDDDDDEVNHESKDEDGSMTKSVVSCEKYGESDILSGEYLEKSPHPKDDDISEMEGCDYSVFGKFPTDIENPTEFLASENGELLNADKDLGLKDAAAVLLSGNVMDTVAALQSSMLRETNHSLSVEPVVDEDSAKTEFDGLTVPVGAEDQKHNLELQSLASKESDMNYVRCQFCTDYDQQLNDVPDFEIAIAKLSDEKALCDDSEINLETNEVEDLESTLIAEDNSKDKAVSNKAEVDFETPFADAGDESKDNKIISDKAEVDFEKAPLDDAETDLEANEVEDPESTLMAEGKPNDTVLSDNAEVDLEKGPVDDAKTDLKANEVDAPESALMAEGKPNDMVFNDNAEVDVVDYFKHLSGSNPLEIERHLTSETLHCGEESYEPVIESSKMDELESCKPATTEFAAHIEIIDVADNNMFNQLAGQNSINFDNHMPSSLKTADPLLVQMTCNSGNVTCPASLTPVKKSSSSTPTTNRKINNLLDINKENIDNSGKKLDDTKEKGMKDNKNTVELADASLRQLRKMFKKKLQITNDTDINEEKKVAKQVGRARPALQTLPENRLATNESENGN